MTAKQRKKDISYTMVDSLKEMGIRIGDVSHIDSEAKKNDIVMYFNREKGYFLELLKFDEKQVQVLGCNIKSTHNNAYLLTSVVQELIIHHELKPYKYVGQ